VLSAPLFLLLFLLLEAARGIHRLRCGLDIRRRELPGLLAVQLENSGIRHRLDKQIRQSPDERVDSIRRITRCGAVKIASEPAHLIFEHRKSADVMDFVFARKAQLRVRRGRFSCRPISLRRRLKRRTIRLPTLNAALHTRGKLVSSQADAFAV